MTVGVTVGAITYAVTSTSSNKRKIRRTATKAMKTVGSVIDSISYMMR